MDTEIPGAYTSPEVTMITGMTYRQLDHCIATGLVVPSIEPGQGSGHRRLFSAADVSLLRVITALRVMGVRGRAMQTAVSAVNESMEKTGFLLIPTNGDPYLGPVADAAGHDACCVVNLTAIFYDGESKE